MKKLFSILFISMLPILTANATDKAATTAAALEKSQTIKNSGIWIDVRSPEEFAEGHLEDAINIPHDQIVAKITEISADKNAPLNLYCRSGRRAENALQELRKLGYTNVINHGGYQELLSKGVR